MSNNDWAQYYEKYPAARGCVFFGDRNDTRGQEDAGRPENELVEGSTPGEAESEEQEELAA